MRVITVANQKGGCGKTTLVQMIANIFSQAPYNYKILVLDNDEQISIFKTRQSDLNNSSDRPSYDVVTMDVDGIANLLSTDCLDRIQGEVSQDTQGREVFVTEWSRQLDLLAALSDAYSSQVLYQYDPGKELHENYDLILLDVPGTIMRRSDLTPLYILSDVVITPFKSTRKDLLSTMEFMKLTDKMRQIRQKQGLELPLYSLINEAGRDTDYKNTKVMMSTVFESNNAVLMDCTLMKRLTYSRLHTMTPSLLEKAQADEKRNRNVSETLEIKRFTKCLEAVIEQTMRYKNALDIGGEVAV